MIIRFECLRVDGTKIKQACAYETLEELLADADLHGATILRYYDGVWHDAER